MKRTSLYEKHLAADGRMVDFAGWEMPVQYSSLKDEILAIRNKVGVFDVSHMGEFWVTGPEAFQFIESLIPNSFDVEVGKAVYSPLLNREGKMLDDLIVYKVADQKVLICVNAANVEKDWNWIEKAWKETNPNCEIKNSSDSYSLLAVQGPETEKVMEKVFGKSFTDIPYYGVDTHSNDQGEWVFARTGYTGEDGFEVFGNHEQTVWLWDELMKQGVAPCGLGARDTLRLEVCYPLYGNELNDQLTPLDAGLKWTTKLDKGDFIGKSALVDYKPIKRLIKLSLEKGIPRAGYDVLNMSGEKIGEITSGTMSPILNKGIALALIEVEKFPEDKSFQVEIRGKQYPATYHTKAFVQGGHK